MTTARPVPTPPCPPQARPTLEALARHARSACAACSRSWPLALCAVALPFATLAAPAAAATLAAAAATPAAPAPSCSATPYAYAGLFATVPAAGIRSVITPLAPSQVAAGHVAAWIGVGGPAAGPGGSAEWLQAGIESVAGTTSSSLYAEIALPGAPVEELTLAQDVVAGSSYDLAVEQVAGEADVWVVLLDGVPATQAVFLPGSSGFAPMAMSESWNGGGVSCNGYAFRFTDLATDEVGRWQPMTSLQAPEISDLGYEVSDRTPEGFIAESG